MKFASIYLSNYIGIYNGMGLYEMHIDMTKCKNRITIIRGDNGSGKSTLAKAMSLFPDPSDAFIPGLSARKEIVLSDGPTLYKLSFIHNVKANGEREVTKAYITKTFGDQVVELNENGNVSSYKDILYNELGLDANFAALSQLSNDDRGLADKKPAERKRFVNSIISSLDTYNNIYKVLSKRSSNYKSMINAVVAKLNILGDEETLTSSLDSLEHRINMIQDAKDNAVAALAQAQSTIAILDPDNSIQNTNRSISAELELAEGEERKIRSTIQGLMKSNGITSENFESDYKDLVARKNNLLLKNQLDRKDIESLLTQKEAEADELNRKTQKLAKLNTGMEYEELKIRIAECEKEMAFMRAELERTVGITDILKISKDEYVIALETLKDLATYISDFKSMNDFEIISKIVEEYSATGIIPDRRNLAEYNDQLSSILDQKAKEVSERDSIMAKISLMDGLSLRPAKCKIDDCPFIKEALDISKTNPHSRADELASIIYGLEAELDITRKLVSESESYNNAVNQFAIIIREIDKNGAILSKMPNGEMFKNKALFLERLLSGYSFDYMNTIYQYIDNANTFDEYRRILDLYNEYKNELKAYEGKEEVIKSLLEDINSINKALTSIADKIEPINREISNRDQIIANLQKLEGVYDAIFVQLEALKKVTDKIDDCRKKLIENDKKMKNINEALVKENAAKEEISQCTYTLTPLFKERDQLSHSVQLMKDYTKELGELEANHEFIETIKYYSSPTTGIQLVFMELYMGKIIELANELLGFLFQGQFVIQPFIINDSEFRIPCLGSGYLNDDISSMSSSQIGMISMILSFALLHHSSTKYNIIKLDEIDGPLDYNNRVYFIDVLNKIMDIMHTEQCIMISHNSELQVDDSDVILLKHDEANIDYNRGNVIWKY